MAAMTAAPCYHTPPPVLGRSDAGIGGIQSAPILTAPLTGGTPPPPANRPGATDVLPPRSAQRPALRHSQRAGRAAPDRLDLDRRPSRPSQSRTIFLLQRRGLPPAAGNVLGHGRARPWRPQGLGGQYRGDGRVRGQPRHLGPARCRQRQLDRGAARLRRVRACRPRQEQVRGGQAAPRRGEPGPSRMRAVPDRRARVRLRPTAPTGWSSAASSASISPTG